MKKKTKQERYVPVVAQEISTIKEGEKLLLVCSICGSKDISATSGDGEYYGTVEIILPDSEDEREDFYKKNIDPYNFYCGDCDENVELTCEEDWKSDNSQTCCANCGNDNYECPSRFVGIERYCEDCDTKEPEIVEYWQYLEKKREKIKENDDEEIQSND
jgi:hypothetical protein